VSIIIGNGLPSTVGKPLSYFEERYIDLDTRGTIVIHSESHWGFYIKVITAGHDIHDGLHEGFTNGMVDRPVVVDEMAWICSCATLYGCHIGEHAIVAFGSVVRAQEVKPYTMVAGNPAKVIARWDGHTWKYIGAKYEVLE
jgi:acetyltransferase-like isoleucine patch superfamily enzyme